MQTAAQRRGRQGEGVRPDLCGRNGKNEALTHPQAPALRRKGHVWGCGWEQARPEGTVRNKKRGLLLRVKSSWEGAGLKTNMPGTSVYRIFPGNNTRMPFPSSRDLRDP